MFPAWWRDHQPPGNIYEGAPASAALAVVINDDDSVFAITLDTKAITARRRQCVQGGKLDIRR